MKKKEVNINEESTSAGGAHAVNKFRISDFVMMAVIVNPLRQLRITFPACSSEIPFPAIPAVMSRAFTSGPRISPSMLTRRYLQTTP